MGGKMAPEVKKIAKVAKSAASQRQNVKQQDIGLIDKLLHACESLDSETAIDLLMQPESILGLIDTSSSNTHNYPCIYALHAIVLILIGENRRKILSQMNPEQLKVLKKCFAVAVKQGRPQVDKVLQRLTSEKEKTVPNPETITFLDKQLTIFQLVDDDWKEIMTDMKKWSAAVEHYDATKKQKEQKALPQPQSEKPDTKIEPLLYSLQELFAQLGYESLSKFNQDRKKVIESHPEAKQWFVKQGPKVLFDVKYLQEFAKLMKNDKPKRKRRAKLDSTKVPAEQSNGKTFIPEKEDSMQATVNKLEKMLEEQTRAANSTKERLEKARALMEERNRAQEQEKRAQERLRAIDAEISKLIGEHE